MDVLFRRLSRPTQGLLARLLQAAVAVSVMAGISVPAAMAAADDAVTVELAQSKVVQVEGRETLVDADKAQPGDVLEYRARYTNHTGKPVKNLLATLPLPAGLEFVGDSAGPKHPKVQASIGDGKYAPLPLMRTVPGKKVPEAVPYEEYRSLRWQFVELAAGKSVEVKARARVVLPKIAQTENAPNAAQAPPVAAATKNVRHDKP